MMPGAGAGWGVLPLPQSWETWVLRGLIGGNTKWRSADSLSEHGAAFGGSPSLHNFFTESLQKQTLR